MPGLCALTVLDALRTTRLRHVVLVGVEVKGIPGGFGDPFRGEAVQRGSRIARLIRRVASFILLDGIQNKLGLKSLIVRTHCVIKDKLFNTMLDEFCESKGEGKSSP